MPLHLTKVAFGHDSVEDLRQALGRYGPGQFWLTTRYLPKRHEEIVGGSLFWILRHQLVARTPITGFGELPGGKTAIHCEPVVIDGPFIEAKEVLGGFWIINVPTMADAIEWAKRCPASPNETIEVRKIQQMDDYSEEIQEIVKTYPDVLEKGIKRS